MDRLLELGLNGIVVELLGLMLGLGAQLCAVHANEGRLRPSARQVVGHQRALCGNRGQLLNPRLYSSATSASASRQRSGESDCDEQAKSSNWHLRSSTRTHGRRFSLRVRLADFGACPGG
jgi:hypothetical protein